MLDKKEQSRYIILVKPNWGEKMILTNKKLSKQARDAILEMINNELVHMSKLPSEQELSVSLGVSRNTIREALKSLENEGIVAPRQGVGTFVIRNSNNIKSNLTVLDSFTKILTNHGYKPGTTLMSFDRRNAPKYIGYKLNLEPSSEILYIDRVRTADDKPVIYIEDYISYIDGMYEKLCVLENESLFHFLKSFGFDISFSSCNIKAKISDEKIGKKLSLKEPTALLHLEQIHYTTKGVAILYSNSYFISEKFDFNLIRRTDE